MKMFCSFQTVSYWGQRLGRSAVGIGLSKFKDVRWYVKDVPQENLEQSKREIKQPPKLIIKPLSRINLLAEFFDLSRSTVADLISKEPRLKQVDKFDMYRNILTLNRSGIDPGEVRNNLQLLYFCPLTIEHRIAILQELGLQNLSAHHFRKFSKLFGTSVALLKTYNLVPSSYDVKDVFSLLGLPEHMYENLRLPKELNSLKLSELHRLLSFSFLCWYFSCEQESIDYIYNIYPPSVVKSMRLQKLLFKRLEENWNFGRDEILKHGFLLCGSPSNVELIEEHVKHLCGADPKVVVHYAPRILIRQYQRLCQIVNMLIDLQIKESAVLQYPNIFTLHPQTIEDRIKLLQQTPEFSGLLSHPRVLRLLYFNTKAKKRLDLVRQLKDTRSVPSLNILTGGQEKFNNYVALGYIKFNRRDVVTFLSKHFKVGSAYIRKSLRIPSQKHQPSVVSVKMNLAFLQEKGFSSEQILSSLEVLLYPPDLVKLHVQLLKAKMESTSDKEFVNSPNILQMLLYYLDKDVPF